MRRLQGLLGIAVGLMLVFHAGAIVAMADDHGNNGTIKIHETANDKDHEMENDPHVCSFHISGMNFDNDSSGTWWIERWAPSGSGRVSNGAWHADGTGYWRTNDMTLANGHYKAFAKQDAPATSGGDKQKVFWVDCAGATSGGTATSGTTTGATTTSTGGTTTGTTTGATTGTTGTTTGGTTGTTGATTGTTGTTTGGTTGTTGATTGTTGTTTGGTTGTTTGGTTAGTTTGATTGTTGTTTSTGGTTTTSTGGTATGGAGNVTGGEVGTTGGTEAAPTGGTVAATTGGTAAATTGAMAGAQANVATANGQTAASGVSANVANLPSTSTIADTTPEAGLGLVLIGLGALLLRRRVPSMQ